MSAVHTYNNIHPSHAAIMRTMLELSRNAEYDVIAAVLIVAVIVAAKYWIHSLSREEKNESIKNR